MSYDNKYKVTQRKKQAKFVSDYKESVGGCVKCGYNEHIEVLEFHHRDPFLKEFEISKVRNSAVGFDRLKAEMDKCDVICPNCHRWLHYCERSSWGKLTKDVAASRKQ